MQSHWTTLDIVRQLVVHEALFLDDPSRAKVSIADIKSFLTSDEDGTVDSRYNDTRLVRNQVRAFASNDLPEERFESKSEASTISEQDFFSLLSDIFAGDKEKDVLAVLKRSIVFLFGNQALYLRLPSEQRNAIVHRIDMDGLHQDLLSDRDKPLYGKYKGGTFETGPTFDADVLKEERMVEEGVAHMTECENVQQYIQQVTMANSRTSSCFVMPSISLLLRAHLLEMKTLQRSLSQCLCQR